MKLILDQKSNQDPRARVKWRLSPSDVRLLEDANVKDAKVLLITWNEATKKEERWLAPLARGEQYVQFHGAGANRVFASVVWGAEDDDLWKKYMAKAKVGKYQYDLVTPAGSLFTGHRVVAQQSVHVDARFFAHKPPKWVDEWVNGPWEGAPRDDCAFRKRALFAFTLQPLLAVIIGALALVVLVGVSVVAMLVLLGASIIVLGTGYTGVSWKAVFLPMNFEGGPLFHNPFDSLKEGFFIRRNLWYVTPTALGVYVLLAFAVQGLVGFLRIHLSTVAVAAVILLIAAAMNALEKRSSARAAMPKPVLHKPLVPLGLLTNGGKRETVPHSFGDSVALIFQGAKAAVCRPFAW